MREYDQAYEMDHGDDDTKFLEAFSAKLRADQDQFRDPNRQ